MNIAFYLHDEVNPESFEQRIIWFKNHYNPVSINELREHVYGGKKLKNACMLSVDDGWRSTYDIIFPIMKKHNVPFTIFVSPHITRTGKNFWYYSYKFCNQEDLKNIIVSRGYFSDEVRKFPCDLILKEIPVDVTYDVIEEYLSSHPEVEIPRGFMNTEELLELHRSGLVEIGAHSLTHPILKGESRERSKSEIINSVEQLSDLIGTEVKSFAYPNGLKSLDFDNDEMQFAKEAGIDMAFTVHPGVITSRSNSLALPRWGSMARLKFSRLGQYLPSRAHQAQIRQKIKECRS